ncbi:dihydrofolate reductase family protein [Amycolatopsis sp. lyj-90]|uniref:dihydrofolate reductase family protein n=1 Tax=Amycolatopsis sp. lyj-90 TaxID=2789285 RepID=UPI003978EEEC
MPGDPKAESGGTAVRWLLSEDLVDELRLLLCPVVVGTGSRLFPTEDSNFPLTLKTCTAFGNGVVQLLLTSLSSPDVRSCRDEDLRTGGWTSQRRPIAAAARLKRPKKCQEFETDHGDVAVRQPGTPRSHKIDMSRAVKTYPCHIGSRG